MELRPHGYWLAKCPLTRRRMAATFSLGEKVAEGRGRMRGFVTHKMFAKKQEITTLFCKATLTHGYSKYCARTFLNFSTPSCQSYQMREGL
jgi:hypothetical protein